MIGAVARRVVDLVLVAFGVSVLTFLMIHLVPGDTVQVMLGSNAETSPEQIAAVRAQLGLDRPLAVQYLLWAGHALRGDLGRSVWTGAPVMDEISARLGVTVELTVLSLLLSAALGLPLGCLMAATRRRWADYLLRVVSIGGITVPSFWLGTMLLYGATVAVPDAALLGWVPFGEDPGGNLSRMALPVLALALPATAAFARVVRAAMQDALAQDYVRTARAKGLPPRRVLGHALRNALVPFLTSFGITAGYLFGGSVVVEQVFALPGLGRLMLGAIAERNYPLVQAAILLATLAFVAINAVVDVLYAVADPRVRRR